MSLGWAGAISDQHKRIATRGTVTFTGPDLDAARNSMAGWIEAMGMPSPDRISESHDTDGVRIEAVWKGRE